MKGELLGDSSWEAFFAGGFDAKEGRVRDYSWQASSRRDWKNPKNG